MTISSRMAETRIVTFVLTDPADIPCGRGRRTVIIPELLEISYFWNGPEHQFWSDCETTVKIFGVRRLVSGLEGDALINRRLRLSACPGWVQSLAAEHHPEGWPR